MFLVEIIVSTVIYRGSNVLLVVIDIEMNILTVPLVAGIVNQICLTSRSYWLDSLLDRDDEDYKRGKALLDELADLL